MPLEWTHEIGSWESAWHSVLDVAPRREVSCLGAGDLVTEPGWSQGWASLCCSNFSTLSHTYPTHSHTNKHTLLLTTQTGHMALCMPRKCPNSPFPCHTGSPSVPLSHWLPGLEASQGCSLLPKSELSNGVPVGSPYYGFGDSCLFLGSSLCHLL